MHLNKFKFGMAVTAGAMIMATAQAAIQDTVTFSGVIPAMTTTYTLGTNAQHTSPVSYILGRIDYTGDTTEINGTTGDWVADNAMRVDYPGGAPLAPVNPINGTTSYTGTATYAGSLFVNNGATVPVNGVWNFWFVNTFDDSPTGQTDNTMNITFNFTDEVPGAPPSTAVSVDPDVTATTTVALNVTAGGVSWYKVNVANPTDALKYLDISTDNSGQDLDFGWFDAAGNWVWDVDGTPPTWEPGLSFGGAGNTRPAIGTFIPNGANGNITAGTYYLAVSFYNISVSNGWTATTSDTISTYTGVVRFDTGTSTPPPPPPPALYWQPIFNVADAGNGDSTLNGSLDGGITNYDRQVADDFTVPAGGWNVTHVGASYINQGTENANTVYEVTLFQQTGTGEPGAVVATFNRPASALTKFNQGVYFGFPTFYYYIDLGTTQALSAGNYSVMVRIKNDPTTNAFWMWSSPTTPINGFASYHQAGPGTLGVDATWPTSWVNTSSIFVTAHDVAFGIHGTASGGNTASGTVDLGQLTAAYNTGANLPTSVPVSFRDGSNTEIATGTASYNPVTGAFSAAVPGSVTVPYRVSFKFGFWLRKTMPNPADPAAPVGNYAFGTVTPLVGDSDDDNEVTNFDYSLWAAANGNSVTANTDNDFDGDGEITNFDYSLWAANNGALGDN
ncbi:MAG TPA: hypothetical protein PLO61_11275 [Fimbriimonadaceae bacterium]|nr:hypothetical protein [Fimbriimonadaceae bacterium]